LCDVIRFFRDGLLVFNFVHLRLEFLLLLLGFSLGGAFADFGLLLGDGARGGEVLDLLDLFIVALVLGFALRLQLTYLALP